MSTPKDGLASPPLHDLPSAAAQPHPQGSARPGASQEVDADREHADYDWCVTEWYDQPLRAFAIVPDDEGTTERLVEVRTNLAWVDANGDHHVRLSDEDVRTARDMLDGKTVQDYRGRYHSTSPAGVSSPPDPPGLSFSDALATGKPMRRRSWWRGAAGDRWLVMNPDGVWKWHDGTPANPPRPDDMWANDWEVRS